MKGAAVTFLRGAIVQKVDRLAPFCTLVSLRLPGRSIALAVVSAREGAAIGPIADRPKKQASADAETMRWRKLLEGSRVTSVALREDGGWARLTMVRAGEPRAIVATREGATLVVGAGAEPNEEQTEVEAEIAEATLTRAAEEALARAMQTAHRERRRALLASIDVARKKMERRIEAVRGDLTKIAQADALVARGKLLAAHAHAIPRGAKEATLDDWSTGEARAVTIALDPSKSARDQAEALFSRAKRMRRGEVIARSRLAEAERSLATMRALREEATTNDDLDVVEKKAHALGARVTKSTPGAKSKEAPRLPYNVFRSGEREVFVGRGAKDNDALTTKVARPHDLWLHAKNRTGAHVVVPLSKTESCPTELLVDAAHLAAHFSDARGESIVEVQYVARRHVRKPRGSAPGAVVVDREKVIVLRVEPARIARLLSSENA